MVLPADIPHKVKLLLPAILPDRVTDPIPDTTHLPSHPSSDLPINPATRSPEAIPSERTPVDPLTEAIPAQVTAAAPSPLMAAVPAEATEAAPTPAEVTEAAPTPAEVTEAAPTPVEATEAILIPAETTEATLFQRPPTVTRPSPVPDTEVPEAADRTEAVDLTEAQARVDTEVETSPALPHWPNRQPIKPKQLKRLRTKPQPKLLNR